MTDHTRDHPVKSDAEQLLDAQLLIGIIERYRPGTTHEARCWFADHLIKTLLPEHAKITDLGRAAIALAMEEPGHE